MKADMELVIVHDGEQWIASNDSLKASGCTLPELDENLKQVIIKSGVFKPGTKITVFMGFDYSTIPTWIRQYAAHYFNRYVSIEL
ncbi:MAG: DUF5395 domain-containing protein [Peptococcaceae bacterium]|nr:DUF5395 domain-containing protein [Peptococcaceae bacterium]